MRKSHKKTAKTAKSTTAQDREFERMYRTIPTQRDGRRTEASQLSGELPVKPRWKRILKRILIVLLILVLLAGAWLGWKFVANGIKIFGWGGVKDLFSNSKLKGEDEGRVNVLLAGNSADDPGHGGAALTDSIMIASINTKTNKAFLLSIPRDLYVDIPNHGYAKINEAFPDGEKDKFSESGYADGGMGLLEKTVSEYFGIPIHYYALVNYTALKQGVNAVGGIEVTIESSDPRGLYDPSPDLLNNRLPLVKLPNGVATLDGTAALGLARARGDSSRAYGYGKSDFTRTENQRKILIGLKDKAVSVGTLSNPVKVGQLFDTLGDNVQTDLTSGEAKRLYDLSKKVSNANIKSGSLNDADGKNLLTSYRNKRGQSTLVPAAGIDDYTDIKAYVDKLQLSN